MKELQRISSFEQSAGSQPYKFCTKLIFLPHSTTKAAQEVLCLSQLLILICVSRCFEVGTYLLKAAAHSHLNEQITYVRHPIDEMEMGVGTQQHRSSTDMNYQFRPCVFLISLATVITHRTN